MRYVITRVLPLPAPARISTGPSVVSTASRCCGFSSSRNDKALTQIYFQLSVADCRSEKSQIACSGQLTIENRQSFYPAFVFSAASALHSAQGQTSRRN